MNDPLPSAIRIQSIAGGVRYHLPPSPSPMASTAGKSLLVFGVIVLVVVLAIFMPLWGGLGQEWGIGMLFPALPFCLFGLALALGGAFLWRGRTEIEATRETLSSTVILGPLRWQGRRPTPKLTRLVHTQKMVSPKEMENWDTLVAECQGSRSLLLAYGYPQSWLKALAEDLAPRLGIEPLPIHSAVTGSSSSWKPGQTQVPFRGSGCGRLGGALFFGMFLGIGSLFFVLINWGLMTGDPNVSLPGEGVFRYLWALFPVPHMAVGAIGLYWIFFRKPPPEASPEQAAVAAASKTNDAPKPSEPQSSATLPPGTDLKYRLELAEPPGLLLVLFLVGFLLCSGVVTPLLSSAVPDLLKGNFGSAFGVAACFGLFLGIFWVLLLVGLVRSFLSWRLGRPVVEIDRHPLLPGDTCELAFSWDGKAFLRQLQILFICEESASYQQGTDTRTETRLVHREELLDERDVWAKEDPRVHQRRRIVLPEGAMHTFEAKNNKVLWKVRVICQTSGLLRLKFTDDLPVQVVPNLEANAP